MLGTILIVVLILALLGALPRWSHSRDWGYAPTGGLGLVIVIVVVLEFSAAFEPCRAQRFRLAPRSEAGGCVPGVPPQFFSS